MNYPKNKVKCPKCEVSFDRNEEDFIKVGKRYYHTECKEVMALEAKEREKKKKNVLNKTDKDREKESYKQLISYICQLRDEKKPSMLILSQIKRYKEAGMTYDGIRFSLLYFHEVKNHNVDKKSGIGIVEAVYEVAKDYFINEHEKKMRNAQKDATLKKDIIYRSANSLKRKQSTNFINLEEIKW